jgi:hypothetical protein
MPCVTVGGGLKKMQTSTIRPRFVNNAIALVGQGLGSTHATFCVSAALQLQPLSFSSYKDSCKLNV